MVISCDICGNLITSHNSSISLALSGVLMKKMESSILKHPETEKRTNGHEYVMCIYKLLFWVMLPIVIWWFYCTVNAQSSVSGLSIIDGSKSTVVLFVVIIAVVAVCIIKKIHLLRVLTIGFAKLPRGAKIGLLFALLVFQVLVILSLGPIAFNWDPREAINLNLSPQEWSFYLSIYPNNILQVRIVGLVLRLLPQSMHNIVYLTLALQLINVVLVDACIVIQYFIFSRFGQQVAAFGVLATSLLIGVGGLFLTPYTDSMCLPFVYLQMLLAFEVIESDTMGKRVTYSVALGLFTYWGYLMKPSSVIPIIAFVIIYVIYSLALCKYLAVLAVAVSIAAGMGLGAGIWGLSESRVNTLKADKSLSMPMTEFMMMGLTGTGGYNLEDVENTNALPSKEAKIEYNIDVIRQRLSDYGPIGYGQFLIGKTANVFTDGTLGFCSDGSNGPFSVMDSKYVPNAWKPFIQNAFARLFASYYDCHSRGHQTIALAMQLVWSVVSFYLLQAIVSLIRCNNYLFYSFKKMTIYSWVTLAVFGGVLFLMMFESGRSRYLIQFIPYIVLLSSFGFALLSKYRSTAENHRLL